MRYVAESRDGYVLITLQESGLDEQISHELKMLSVNLSREGTKSMVFNLERCTQCDDSGLGALLIANRLCWKAGGKCILTSVQEEVLQRIRAYRLEAALTVVQEIAEAEKILQTT